MDGKAAYVALKSATFLYDRPYVYRLPPELSTVEAGMRVIVPFGKGDRLEQGLVLKVADSFPKEAEEFEIKDVKSVLEPETVVSGELLKVIMWVRSRCFCTCYDVLRACLPPGMDYKREELYRLEKAESGGPDPDVLAGLEPDLREIVEYVKCRGGVVSESEFKYVKCAMQGSSGSGFLRRNGDFSGVNGDFSGKNRDFRGQTGSFSGADDPLFDKKIEKLIRLGVLSKASRERRAVGDKTVRVAYLTGDIEGLKLTPRQREVCDFLKGEREASVKDITYYTGASSSVLKTLEKKGIIGFFEREVLRTVRPAMLRGDLLSPPVLSPKQKEVYDGLADMMDAGQPSAALLCGVTGSGKTLIYVSLIYDALEKGKGAMVLVPEIALTPQLLETFYGYFGPKVAVMHSGLSQGERLDEWKRIKAGEARVVIGTRSAVFAPLDDIGLIVIDEEQEHTYKSESSPTYHARDVAKFRAVCNSALLLLGSATPSVESMYAAQSGKYRLFELSERYGDLPLPEVMFADMRDELMKGNSGNISALLAAELRKNIENGEQSILFLNRRGRNRALVCERCGNVPKCPNCSVSLTYHLANNRLMCHYCGHSRPVVKTCPQCGSSSLSYEGAGTQKIEEELAGLFPGVGVVRMDADTTGGKQSHESLLLKFREERVPILLGTQMIVKGLDFENVTLVGVLNADQQLNGYDFRAGERAFSQLTQVVGRAGRGAKKGRAVLQTLSVKDPVIRAAARQDYMSFYREEIEFRRAMGYPPFCDILAFTVSGEDELKTLAAADEVRKMAERLEALGVIGPAPLPVYRLNGKYRLRITVKTRETKRLRDAAAGILKEFMSSKRFAGLSLKAEFDPLE